MAPYVTRYAMDDAGAPLVTCWRCGDVIPEECVTYDENDAPLCQECACEEDCAADYDDEDEYLYDDEDIEDWQDAW